MNYVDFKAFAVIILIAFLTLFSTTCQAQITEQWVARYGGDAIDNDEAVAVDVDGNGNIYVTGSVINSSSYHDYTTVKYNPAGETQWAVTYNGPGNGVDWVSDMAVDADANIYITGTSQGGGTSNDFATVKYDSEGTELWVARYNSIGDGEDQAYSIALDLNGNVYVSGACQYLATIIKYNSSGELQWAAVTEYELNSDPKVSVDSNGNAIIAGSYYRPATLNDMFIIKYDTDGNEEWFDTYNNSPVNESEIVSDIAVDSRDNVIITGYSYRLSPSGSYYNYDYCTLKYNSQGDQLWVKCWNEGLGYNDDKAYALAVDADDNIYVTGWCITSDGFNPPEDAFGTLKYSPTGSIIWQRVNEAGMRARSIALDQFGNVCVAGDGETYSYFTQWYNPDGSGDIYKIFEEFGFEEPQSVILDTDGNTYVTGLGRSEQYDNDFITVKYSRLTGIKDESLYNNGCSEFSLHDAYPNPFNPTTTLSYSLPASAQVQLTVYDIQGREVDRLVDGFRTTGSHQVTFDAKGLTSGVYFARLEAGEFGQTRKILLVK